MAETNIVMSIRTRFSTKTNKQKIKKTVWHRADRAGDMNAQALVLVSSADSWPGLEYTWSIHEVVRCENPSSFLPKTNDFDVKSPWATSGSWQRHVIDMEWKEKWGSDQDQQVWETLRVESRSAALSPFAAQRDGFVSCTRLITTIIPRKRAKLTTKLKMGKKHKSVCLVIFFLSLLCSLSLQPSPINCHLWGNTQAIVNYNATVLGFASQRVWPLRNVMENHYRN